MAAACAALCAVICAATAWGAPAAFAQEGTGSAAIPDDTVTVWVDVEGASVADAGLSGRLFGQNLDFKTSAEGVTAIASVDSSVWGKDLDLSIASERSVDATVAVTCVGDRDVVIADSRTDVSLDGNSDAVAVDVSLSSSRPSGNAGSDTTNLSHTGVNLTWFIAVAVVLLVVAAAFVVASRRAAVARSAAASDDGAFAGDADDADEEVER
ncbi:hypothetical protein [Pseudoscardovia radai]|uniref:hypothetical protein n=1 Tax=Pseudoscardovia radai TaxID=987066 RepID=UPI003993C229